MTNRPARISLAVCLLITSLFCSATAAEKGRQNKNGSFRLGMQAYTFHLFLFDQAVEKTASLGIQYMEGYTGLQLSSNKPTVKTDYTMSPEDKSEFKSILSKADVRLVNYYIYPLPNDENECRKRFEFAKEMGVETIVSEPSQEALDLVEKLCKKYEIKLAIHNHPKPSRYWDPNTVLAACKGRSKWIGACADTGHWMRSGIKPVEALKKLKGRVIAVHLKDLNDIGDPKAHDVPWGTGKAGVTEILTELKHQNFKGLISVEYEHNMENSLPEIRQCVESFDKIVNELEPDNLQNILADVKNYQFGQSRLALTKLADLVRWAINGSPQDVKHIEKSMIKFLRSDATWAGKQFVCEQLSLIATEDSVPVLAEMLTQKTLADNNVVPADIARYALERIPSPVVDQALRSALNKTSGKVKAGIICSLGQRRDKNAVAQLKNLIYYPDKEISSAAITALGKIADSQSADILQQAKNNTTGDLQNLVLDSYLRCADEIVARGDDALGMQSRGFVIYRELYDSNVPVDIRAAALKGMITVAGESVAIPVIKGKDLQMQSIAIQLIPEIPGTMIVKTAASQLPELESQLQVQLIYALSARGDKTAQPAVLKAAASDNQTVQIAALKALASLGDASTVGLLTQTAAGNDFQVCEAARHSLYLLPGDDVDKVILAELADSNTTNPKVKIELIGAVKNRGVKEGVDTLFLTARDANKKVRLESMGALRDIAGTEYLDALVELLVGAPSATEQKAVGNTIVAVAGKINGESTKAAALLIDALNKQQDLTVRKSLISTLGRLDGSLALSVLRENLNSTDTDTEVKASVIRALSEWENDEPAADLLKIAESSDSNTNKILALRGFIRLTGIESDRDPNQAIEMYKKAMTLAPTSREKTMVLSALAGLKNLDAIKMAASYLDSNDLQQEAEAAVVSIAPNIIKEEPEFTQAILKRVIDITKNDLLRQQAQDLLDAFNSKKDL